MNGYTYHQIPYTSTEFYVGDGKEIDYKTYPGYRGRYAHLLTFNFESAPLELFCAGTKQTLNFDWYLIDRGETDMDSYQAIPLDLGPTNFDSNFMKDPSKIAPNATLLLNTFITQVNHDPGNKYGILMTAVVPIKLAAKRVLNPYHSGNDWISAYSLRRNMPSLEDNFLTYVTQCWFSGDTTSTESSRWQILYGDHSGETDEQPCERKWMPLSNFWKRALINDEGIMDEAPFIYGLPVNYIGSGIYVKGMSIPTSDEEVQDILMAQEIYESGEDCTQRLETQWGDPEHPFDITVWMANLGLAYRPFNTYVNDVTPFYEGTAIGINFSPPGRLLINPLNNRPFGVGEFMIYSYPLGANFTVSKTDYPEGYVFVDMPGATSIEMSEMLDLSQVILPKQSLSTAQDEEKKDEGKPKS